jgi:pimeloyl-ACP methyl ester carboxylesterase
MKICILPGLDGTGLLLTEVEAVLARENAVSLIRYPTDIYRYDSLLKWVEDAVPDEDFIVVAESFSGPLAIMLASQKPRGLRGVVFVATFARSPIRLPSKFARIARVLPVRSTFLTWLVQPLLMGQWSSKAFSQQFRRALRLVPAKTIAGRLEEVLKVDVREHLQKLPSPFIYLQATRDRLIPSKISRDFDFAPDTIFKINGPHFLLQSKADTAAACISTFIAHLD